MRPHTGQQPRIAFLLGKPVRDTSVLPDVFARLREVPATVTLHLPKGDEPMPSWLFDAALVVQRGLGVAELTSALRLEAAGVRRCNRVTATIAVRDRALTFQKLAAAGLPVPATVRAATWPEVHDLAGERPVVVKAADGGIGRGRGVLLADTGSLPPQEPFAGPYIAQEYIRGDGRDHKVYVAGPQARGLVKQWPPRQTADQPGVPFMIDAQLADLARRVGRALDLEIYGVDFLYGPRGPTVVDVNPFPGFRGVPQAARLIARHLAAITTGQDTALDCLRQ